MDSIKSEKRMSVLVIGAVVLILLVYTLLSADCAVGGSCTFANGDWFNWIATILSR